MKFFYVFLILCVFHVSAQRRPQKSEATDAESTPKPARRGRARFVTTPDQAPIEEQKIAPRRTAVRRRPAEQTERKSPVVAESSIRRNYEVEEVIDETPSESLRRPSKTRTLTETRFEAPNAPPSALFQPSSTESLDEVIKSIGSDILDYTTTDPLLDNKSEVVSSSEANEIKRETTRSVVQVTTPSTSRRRPSNGRSRNNVATTTSAPETGSRIRSRTRATRKPDEVVQKTTVRKRPVEASQARTRGPSVIASTPIEEIPSRTRTGRKITRAPNRRNFDVTRGRSRSRDVPPVIDEQKLEVLPLFEVEAKTVRTTPRRTVKFVSKRRNLNSAEDTVQTSATENDIKLIPRPKKTENRSTTPASHVVVSRKQSVVVETRTESSFKRRKVASKPKIIKESVISEVSEVTSKRTLPIRKPSLRTKVSVSEVVSRGKKKSEVNLTHKNKSSVSNSEEEIDESDNYPPQFKALLQAKKQTKESRPSQDAAKTTEKVVTSSTTTQSEATPQLEDSENELDAKHSSTTATPLRPTRRKSAQQLPSKGAEKFNNARPTLPARRKVARSSTFAPKLNNIALNDSESSPTPVKVGKNFAPKAPTRGLYSSRSKSKENVANTKSTKSPVANQVNVKKTNRFSSRYRHDASSRGAIRTSTNAPAYLPTIPTVTPPTTSEYVWPEEENIEYSWSFSRLF